VAQSIKELPREVRSGLKIQTVSDMRDVLKIALTRPLPRAPRRPARREGEEELGFFDYMKETSTTH
jgi:hypothetical protein